eukprot:CAMPEP_0113597898 /NCGR_PEP_ID=MMETSP0015_2-20120614/41271_1 /TAXON_ID=2838 /ORGANISM="Odontella" /LENGTH=568 /DNA_ID=CAMNT_0000505823 /DNA_START=216 /DNA_END=1922 /DNA_ORIENTATION=- /assembly_acc=CAM_ASM_000160
MSSGAGVPPLPSAHEIALAKSLRSHSLSLHRTFLNLDVDRDGYVTRSDLRAALHNALGVDLSSSQMDAIFARFAFFEDDHRDEVDSGEDDDGENDGAAGAGGSRRGSHGSSSAFSTSSSSRGGRRRRGVHHGIRYAEFVRYIEATLRSSTSSSAAYGSTLSLASRPAERYSPRPQMIAVEPPPDVSQQQLRKSLARIMRQKTKSGGGNKGKNVQLFLEMNTHRDGHVTVEEFREWASNNGLELDERQVLSILGEHYDAARGIDLKEFSKQIDGLNSGDGESISWEELDGDEEERRERGLEAGKRAQAEADEIARRQMEEALKACVDDAMSDRELVVKLSEKLWTRRTRLVDAFKKFDLDKDGKLTARELMAALKEAGMVVSEERAESLVKKFDRDGDGRLNRGDFVRLISSGSEEEEKEEGTERAQEEKVAPKEKPAPAEEAPSKGKPPVPPSPRRASLLASLKGHEDESKAADIVERLDEDDISAIMSFREALDAERIVMRKMFKDMDKNNTKDLDPDELRQGFERLGLEVEDAHIRYIMKRFDPHNTGRLRYHQFVKLVSSNLVDV